MMCYTRYTLEELQCLGMTNDQETIYELGRRALTMDFCLSDVEYCKHKVELLGIQWAWGPQFVSSGEFT